MSRDKAIFVAVYDSASLPPLLSSLTHPTPHLRLQEGWIISSALPYCFQFLINAE